MSDRLPSGHEVLEVRRRLAQERRAQQAAALEAAKARRRRRIRIEIALFVLSAIVVAGILYYDTTRVADGGLSIPREFIVPM